MVVRSETAVHADLEPSAATKANREGRSESVDTIYWPLLFAPLEVGFGFVLLVLGGLGEWRSVGVVVATVAGLLATTDGFVAGTYGRGGWSEAATSHGLPAVVLAGMAFPLLKC